MRWFSRPFYAFKEGYQMCLRVDATGSGAGKSTHVSVYLYLMKGPYDHQLEQSGQWPLRGIFTIELLNQVNNTDYHGYMIQFHQLLSSDYTNRVFKGIMTNSERGHPQFISRDAIISDNNNGYYINDSLNFRISFDHMDPPYQSPPVSFKVTKFSNWLKNKGIWFSSPFFDFTGNYLMYLSIHAAGNDKGKDTHISAYIYLMESPHNDKTQSSVHLEKDREVITEFQVTIELLNQSSDNHHRVDITCCSIDLSFECIDGAFKGDTDCKNWGEPQFLSLDNLLKDNNYYKNDTLYLRVSFDHDTYKYNHRPDKKLTCKDILGTVQCYDESSLQVSPAIFTVSNYSNQLVNDIVYHSAPFYTSEQGYLIILIVDVNSNKRYLSVCLHLIEAGKYNFESRQSGQQPLTGTFTVELLNQIHHNNYRVDYNLQNYYHPHDSSKCIAFDPLFIPRLLIHRSYLITDFLQFRVTYTDAKNSPEPCRKVAPVIIEMSNYTQRSKQQWYSPPFFAFTGGYQMCLRVDATATSCGTCQSTHLSVFLHLMKGPHDDVLEQLGHWPLKGIFTIELLNQVNDSGNYEHKIVFTTHRNGQRIMKGKRSSQGWGIQQFISCDTFYHKNNSYYKDDTLKFRISYEHLNALHQIAPITVKISNVPQWLKSSVDFVSSPFFAFNGGYKMILRIQVTKNNYYYFEDLRFYLHFMKGPHDNNLKLSGYWPISGVFVIESVNINGDINYCFKYEFSHLSTTAVGANFTISHSLNYSQLLFDRSCQGHYINDSLNFRISYIDTKRLLLPLTHQISDFSQWLKGKKYSTIGPFFLFTGGHKMFLIIASDGVADLFFSLYLIKGPHDEKLKQMGKWLLRGSATITIRNRLSDNIIIYRVTFTQPYCYRDDIALPFALPWNASNLISHSSLLHHGDSSYLKDDRLIFKISYDHDTGYYKTAPVNFRITDFYQLMDSNELWVSDPFFAFEGGYTMFFTVKAAGHGDGQGTHVSVFLGLMQGPYDGTLEQSGYWPPRGVFTVGLVDHLDGNNYKMTFNIDRYSKYPERILSEGNEGEQENMEFIQFISHDILFHTDYQYIKNRSLHFKISYKDSNYSIPCNQVGPVTLKMFNFTKMIRVQWYSGPFLAFPGGYQMCLRVDTAASCTHISVFLHLMKGPHDDDLQQLGQWPLKGKFTIELLSHIMDIRNHSCDVNFSTATCSNCTNRVVEGNRASNGWGCNKFIPYDTLIDERYLKKNTLHFRISYQEH